MFRDSVGRATMTQAMLRTSAKIAEPFEDIRFGHPTEDKDSSQEPDISLA